MRRMILALLLLLSACSPSALLPTPSPTPPALEGSVDILYPQDGSIIYSEALTLSGTASASNFALKLVAPDEQVIAETTIQTQGDEWTVELIHNYAGEPIEVNILAVPVDATITTEYDIATILLAPLESRPEGTFGSITMPTEGDTVGGEMIQVSGMASGFAENTLSIALIGSDGTTVDSKNIALHNPYQIDDMPWTAELATNGYTGSAEIRIADGQNIISSITVTITAEAG